jgi:nicotinate-nucleotide pyrophosphorylase (carboxylating)
MTQPIPTSREGIVEQVRAALVEDIGRGDLTAALVDADRRIRGRLICREPAVVCGREWADEIFRQLDSGIALSWKVADGDRTDADTVWCVIEGPARPILSGERTAINFLQTLSGTATATRRYVDRIAASPARMLDTRKTIPGLRQAQKYAVRVGGGANHRSGLYDAILIKENHVRAAGSVAAALDRARRVAPADCLFVEVEVDTLDQLDEALANGAERILLDNFTVADMAEAVRRNAGRARLEASGNVTLDTVADIASTGVDFISSGALTKDLLAIDLSLEFD